MPAVPNICAGPFGALYDFYIERPRLMCAIGRAVWGADLSGLYTSMQVIEHAGEGATIIDAPCGGGVALRALRPQQDVRYHGADLSERMLARARRRARARSLDQVELVLGDMCRLPFADAQADLFLSYSGLHMIADPEPAVREIARCLRPGGQLLGTTFLAEGTRRQRALFGSGGRRGHAMPPALADLRRWFADAGIVEVAIQPEAGFVVFSGRKPPGSILR